MVTTADVELTGDELTSDKLVADVAAVDELSTYVEELRAAEELDATSVDGVTAEELGKMLLEEAVTGELSVVSVVPEDKDEDATELLV